MCASVIAAVGIIDETAAAFERLKASNIAAGLGQIRP